MARGFETTTGLIIQQGIFEESVSLKHRVGTRMQLADGRVYYYAKAGGTLVAGKLCVSVVTPSGHEDVDTAAVSADGKEVTVSLNTTSVQEVNLYAEGFITTRETGGVGQMMKIESHGLQLTTDGDLLLKLYDPCTTALLATGQADLLMNPFKDIIVAANVVHPACGIPMIPVTDNYYAWVQTWGPACCLCDTAATLGEDIAASSDDGSVQDIAAATNDIAYVLSARVGHTIGADGADGKYTMIQLRLFA
jgi:hypothetical protein